MSLNYRTLKIYVENTTRAQKYAHIQQYTDRARDRGSGGRFHLTRGSRFECLAHAYTTKPSNSNLYRSLICVHQLIMKHIRTKNRSQLNTIIIILLTPDVRPILNSRTIDLYSTDGVYLQYLFKMAAA